MGTLDLEKGLLIRDSLFTVVDRSPDQDEEIQFSNFWVDEDRETHELVLYIPYFYPNRNKNAYAEQPKVWTGDLYRYRVAV